MMRTLLALTAGLTALAPAAQAQNLRVYEAFDYGGSSLDNQDGGAGWNGPWVGVNQTSGLYSYWDFENNANDAGPAASNGTLNGGGYSTDAPAALASSTASLSLDSSQAEFCDLAAHVGKYANLRVFAVSAWIKQSMGQGGVHAIFTASDSTEGSKEVRLFIEGGVVRYDVRGQVNSWSDTSSSPLATSTPVNDGMWHHVALSVGPDDVATVWIDGNEEVRGRQGGFRHVFNLDSMAIGRNLDSNPAGQWYFNGLIDDVAVWASTLSQTDVTNLDGGTAPTSVSGTAAASGPDTSTSSLDSPAFGTFGLSPYGGAFCDNRTTRAHRFLAEQIDLRQNTSYYVSALMRREDNGRPTTGAQVQFSDGNAVRGSFGWDDTGAFLCGLNSPTPGPVIMGDATTYFCVFRIDAVSSGDDTAYLKVYAPGDTVDASDAGFSGVGTGATEWAAMDPGASGARNTHVLLTQFDRGSTMCVDELRIGRTWESVTSLTYGDACNGAQMGRTGRPALGNVFTVDLSGGGANLPASMLFGFSRETIGGSSLPIDLTIAGLPGCFLLTSTTLAFATMTDVSGSASMNIAVAADPGSLGLTPFAQWAVLDAMAPNPLAFSEGLEIVVEKP